MAYELPALPYPYEALEPVIDAETMRLHHDKHHQAYVDALNRALEPHPELQGKTIEDLMRGLDQVPEAIRTQVRNQGGGHANHQLFWKIMAPPGHGGGGEPAGDLAAQIGKDFGSLDGMRQAFSDATGQALRLRLGVPAVRPQGGQAGNRDHGQPGQRPVAGQARVAGQRPLGTRLLPQAPEPEARLPQVRGGTS